MEHLDNQHQRRLGHCLAHCCTAGTAVGGLVPHYADYAVQCFVTRHGTLQLHCAGQRCQHVEVYHSHIVKCSRGAAAAPSSLIPVCSSSGVILNGVTCSYHLCVYFGFASFGGGFTPYMPKAATSCWQLNLVSCLSPTTNKQFSWKHCSATGAWPDI